jgi:glutamate dehydrogenase
VPVSATEGLAEGAPAAMLSLVDHRVPPARADAVRAFVKIFARRLKPTDLGERTPEELLSIALGAFGLADRRAPDGVAVRVFDPTLATDGYETLGTVLETSVPDSPFLFDSVNEELLARDLSVRRVIHPVVGIERDADGRIAKVAHLREADQRESLMHFEVDRRLSPADAAELEGVIRGILGDVRLAVRDFEAMRSAARGMIDIARAVSASCRSRIGPPTSNRCSSRASSPTCARASGVAIC